MSLFDHQGHANIPSKIQLVCLSLSCFIATSALGQNPNYNWPSQNLNIHNSRFAELDQINRDNVSRLSESWTFTPGPQDSITQVTPLVAEGTMYLHSANTMFALDAATGEELWRRPLDSGRAGGPFADQPTQTAGSTPIAALTYTHLMQRLERKSDPLVKPE